MLPIDYLDKLGYEECNLNLGCPSGTVVAKGKRLRNAKRALVFGGFFPRAFFLIKGFKAESFCENKNRSKRSGGVGRTFLRCTINFPISEIIVHPRTQKQYYSGKVDLSTFRKIYEYTKIPLVYNGDVETKEDILFLAEQFPNIKGIMCGRGLLSNPALFREALGGKALEEGEFKGFLSLSGREFCQRNSRREKYFGKV